MARTRDWLEAARPLAQVNIAVPLLFGQAVAWATRGAFEPLWLAYLVAFGVVDHLFVVFANDYADRDADGAERTPFSGGSGVLQSGAIAAPTLRKAATSMALALVLLGLAVLIVRPYFVGIALLAVGLLHAYSFPPLRLSYRGGGEWLQAAGVGALLPLSGYYAQTGRLDLPVWALAPSVIAGLAGNMLTAVPDVDQDARAGKRTFAVAHGERTAMIACAVLLLGAALLATRAEAAAPLLLAPLAAGVLAIALAVGLARGDRRRARLRFVVLAGGVQQAIFVVWALALAHSL